MGALMRTSTLDIVTQDNSFSSVFDTKPLDREESSQIEKLLVDNFIAGTASEKEVEADIAELKLLTAEIKAISKQGVILVGERVHQAGELLKPYKDGAFTKWLESTFGSRKTGYNMLNYYTLYNELQNDDLRQKFKKFPQRAAYMLASRKGGTLKAKAEIISKYYDLSPNELVILIQEKLPLDKDDKRCNKNSNERLIDEIRDTVEKLIHRKDTLTHDDKNDLASLMAIMGSFCGVHKV